METVLNSIYAAALLSSDEVKASSMDLWGNVKIPYISSYQSKVGDDWTDVPLNKSKEYSSLVGVPMTAVPTGNNSLTIESTYIELQCSNISTSYNFITLNNSYLGESPMCFSYMVCPEVANGTFQGVNGLQNTSTTWSLGLDTFVDHYWFTTYMAAKYDYSHGKIWAYPSFLVNETGIQTRRPTLLFQSHNVEYGPIMQPNISYTSAYCKVSQVYVESRVNCTTTSPSQRSCTVVSQRPSTKHHTSSNITQISWPQVFNYISRMPLATGQTGLGGISDMALYYINNTSLQSVTTTNQSAIIDNVPEAQFSQRLGQIINSYLMLGTVYTAVTSPEGAFFQGNLSTSAMTSNLREIYVISWGWVVTFLLSTTALLCAAIASVVLEHLAISPEVLGFVSLAVRNSRYVSLPPGTGVMSGLELARELKDKRIRYGIVETTDSGTAVLGTAGIEQVVRVDKAGRYL
jgi:hypothetical protein